MRPLSSVHHSLFVASSAAARLGRARAWLTERGHTTPLVILSATTDAASDLARRVALELGGMFGWHRSSLPRLAAALAQRVLAERARAPVGALALEALASEVVMSLAKAEALGRLAVVATEPGLPRALARTLRDVRAAGLGAGHLAELSAELGRVQAAFEVALEREGLADRPDVLTFATEAAKSADVRHRMLDLPLLLLDVPVETAAERALVAALAARSPHVLATVPAGDERSRRNLEAALGVVAARDGAWSARIPAGLRRTQEHLFDDAVIEPAPPSDEVSVLSAPGESRECVELARLVRREAARGVPFDRMAILLRAPSRYRAHVEEALRRAKIPAHFASGSVRPDPSGRAFLALLSCAAEGLSARRFAEYLSLGEVPDATPTGEPPEAPPSAERWAPPDEELLADVIVRASEGLDPPAPRRDDETGQGAVVQGSLRAPRRWERLLVDAAVIGGSARWRTRLDGLEKELDRARREVAGDEARVGRIDRQRADLACLGGFALPLIELLEGLPRAAVWREWIEHLSILATRALRRPERVVSVLGELVPMAEVGPVELADVRLVLARRLTELVERPTERKFGRIFVAPVDAVRGLSFDVVFVPGLAERMFPEKVSEDPLLPDALRARLSEELETNADRVHRERLALKLAIGAAEQRLVLSYPRVDVEQARPRVPSFYGLEVLRASEGVLPGFDVLTRRAEQRGAARIGWPAPAEPKDAIDEAEHDLALLDRLLHRPEEETTGTARYLLAVNPHLTRALRARARRWIKKWTPADGLVEPIAEARSALLEHAPSARAYSATALEKLASCPYQFFLGAILRLAPREEAEAIEELGPLERGQLIHQVQFRLFEALRARGLLPLVPAALDDARHLLDRIVREVAASFEEELAPAIDRVWDDGIGLVEADLREWLRRTSEERVWTPWRFELAFGLPAEHARERDPDSRPDPVELEIGLKLRGSIDLVERGPTGAVRATDHKTGKVRAKPGVVIGGGSTLQPVLYALALEKLLPGTTVDAGRLYYCTQTGEFQAVDIPLDDRAREGARRVVETVADLVERAFFPAAPAKGACEYCDYRAVCGPHEEHRVTLKRRDALKGLERLREAE